MKSAIDRVHREPPAGDRDPRLARRHEPRRDPAGTRLAIELERDGHLPDRAVGADGEDDLARHLEVRAARHVEIGGRAAEVGQRRARLARERRELGIVARGTGAGRSRSPIPFVTQSRRISRQAGGNRPPCVATPTSATVGASGSAAATSATIGTPSSLLAGPRRVEDRDDVLAAVAQHAAHRLAVVRVAREALGEDQQRAAQPTPRPGSSEGTCTPSTNATPGTRVLGEQEVAVEVDVVAERRNDAAGSDADARLDHAAEHHAETERARGVRHPDRLADPARLRELDVDAVRDLGAARHVGERVAVLVDVDRDRRLRPELLRAGVGGRQRLLDVRDAELDELRDRLERLVERPPLVHVDLQRQVGARADGAHALDVEPVTASELELEPLEAVADELGAPGHVVRVAEPDRPRGRRAAPWQPEQLPDRDAEQLALQVVERAVERCLRRVLARNLGEALADLLQRERIVAEQRSVLLDERERRLGRLVVAVDRGRLAPADVAAVAHLDLDDVLPVARLTRDHERLGQPQPDDGGLDLHLRQPTSRAPMLTTYAITSASRVP